MNRRLVSGILLFMGLALSGCSTIERAYDSTADTVSGWFKSDSEKQPETKQPETNNNH